MCSSDLNMTRGSFTFLGHPCVDAQADFTADAERFVLKNLSLRVHGGTVRSRNGADEGLVYVLARADGVLAIDVHTPGIGELIARLQESETTNVRIIEGDALAVLSSRIEPESLAGVRTWFPDPWPKARHHKRRIVQPAVVDLVHSRLAAGGWWHLATDWAEYAEYIEAVFAADPRWTGGVVPRPDWRPVTRYERRAIRDGRSSVDLVFTRE